MKRIISFVIAVFLACNATCSLSFASEHKIEDNYIYVETEDQVNWDSLSPQDIVVVPNSGVTSSTNANKLSESPAYLHSHESTVLPYGLFRPDDEWNVVENGQYNFKGSIAEYAAAVYLYSEYYFTGAVSYHVKITNNNDSPQTAELRNFFVLYKTVTVPANTSVYFVFYSDTAEHPVTVYTDWYLRFPSPCNVEGYVKEIVL